MLNTPKTPKTRKTRKAPKTKEWTLMFYFASDNSLASTIVSQLKALKDAGYHHEVNVLAHFDPHVVNTPVHVFDINIINKIQNPRKTQVGFAPNDPYVRNLVLDKLFGSNEDDMRLIVRDHVEGRYRGRKVNANGFKYDPPIPPQSMSKEQSPARSFEKFLSFCRTSYPARHYLLIVLGHGEIVGNDSFLQDDNAAPHALSLAELGKIMNRFSDSIRRQKTPGELEMVGFHSCSMNSVEIAYELAGTAKYMLASQGPAFVGSWPYKQLLMRLFNELKPPKKRRLSVEEIVRKMFAYCFYNNYDFQLAGYAFDVCLANLDKVDATKDPIEKLANALIAGLKKKQSLAKDLILLAHLDAQSFADEDYVDLYDFCFCLRNRCGKSSQPDDPVLKDICDAANEVMTELRRGYQKGSQEMPEKLVVSSAFAGHALQYSYGLSVFFPWAEPYSDEPWFKEYSECQLHKQTGWGTFLKQYFKLTRRMTRAEEHKIAKYVKEPNGLNSTLSGRILSLLDDLTAGGRYYGQLQKPGPDHPMGKHGPDDPSGGSCGCGNLKNYPRYT
jgi:hypothetical protein